jgi:uncharacterized repeat protein (TIGR04138 family)
MQEVSFESALELILRTDARYHRDAYHFVREALDFTQKLTGRDQAHRPQHVTGQELLEGIRQYALSQFGPMTITVLEAWGVTGCEDFGNIVFNLVEARFFGKTETDSRDDFRGGYTFEDAFRKPFLPASKRDAAAATAKTPTP